MTNLSLHTTCPRVPPDVMASWFAVATEALDLSDVLINQHFRQSGGVQNKLSDGEAMLSGDVFDPVTEADRGAERIIRKVIEAADPDHGIIGEEFGDKPAQSDVSWIIDPIDGTRAFVAGLPTFGTLLGVLKSGVPAFGAMSQPFTGERYWGGCAGSFYTGPGGPRDLAVSSVSRLQDAVLCSTDANIFPVEDGQRSRFDACRERARIMRFGGDCYNYCLLAAGHVDVVIETMLQPYDIAPLIPIIEGAGGCVTNWVGAPAHGGGQVIAAATPALHAEVLALLSA